MEHGNHISSKININTQKPKIISQKESKIDEYDKYKMITNDHYHPQNDGSDDY